MARTANYEQKRVLRAAAALMLLSLRSRDPVEIYCDGQFWKARVTDVERNGFRYQYCGSDECGRVLFSELHSSWRFPLCKRSKHYNAESILLMI
jgi:hypothetical protein